MLWKKMYHYFMLNNDAYMAHYHKRSNSESTVHMMKSKFGDSIRSKTWTAQVNETLCKVICHNICVIIQSMYELGITPESTKQTFLYTNSRKNNPNTQI